MDKATIKMVLSAYRVGGQDAHDPIFAEALREAGQDPELTAWFEERQRFDETVIGTLKRVPAPAGLKEMILLNAKTKGGAFEVVDGEARSRWGRQAGSLLAMAACLALAFFLGRQTLPNLRNAAPRGIAAAARGGDGADRLALQAIDYTGKMPALQFVCFDPVLVAHWVEEKASAMKMGEVLDRPMSKLQMIGSSTAQWDGRPVIMIALQNGSEMAMLYIVRASDFPGASQGAVAGEIMEKDGWITKTGQSGEHLYVLATKGTRKNLDFPMPL